MSYLKADPWQCCVSPGSAELFGEKKPSMFVFASPTPGTWLLLSLSHNPISSQCFITNSEGNWDPRELWTFSYIHSFHSQRALVLSCPVTKIAYDYWVLVFPLHLGLLFQEIWILTYIHNSVFLIMRMTFVWITYLQKLFLNSVDHVKVILLAYTLSWTREVLPRKVAEMENAMTFFLIFVPNGTGHSVG